MAKKTENTTTADTAAIIPVSPNPVVKEKTKEETPKKRISKPRAKVRSLEELADIPASKMTDKEKDKVIKELREQLNLQNNKSEHYKQNAESAFAQTRDMEAQYTAMEKFYMDSYKNINLQLAAFADSIKRITGGIN